MHQGGGGVPPAPPHTRNFGLPTHHRSLAELNCNVKTPHKLSALGNWISFRAISCCFYVDFLVSLRFCRLLLVFLRLVDHGTTTVMWFDDLFIPCTPVIITISTRLILQKTLIRSMISIQHYTIVLFHCIQHNSLVYKKFVILKWANLFSPNSGYVYKLLDCAYRTESDTGLKYR